MPDFNENDIRSTSFVTQQANASREESMNESENISIDVKPEVEESSEILSNRDMSRLQED